MFLEKITYANIHDLRSISFLDINNKVYLINPQSGDKISCEQLADDYNSRKGVYSELFSNLECQAKDYPTKIIHLDGNLKKQQP